MLQPLPSDILLQLLVSPTAPVSVQPGDATQAGDNAFATALQLLLGETPSGMSDTGAVIPGLADFPMLPIDGDTALLTSGLPGSASTTSQLPSDPTALLMALPTVPGFTPKSVAGTGTNATDQTGTAPLSPELAALIALTQGTFLPGAGNGQGTAAVVTDDAVAPKNSSNQASAANGAATIGLLSWSSLAGRNSQPAVPQSAASSIVPPVVPILSGDGEIAAQVLDSTQMTQPAAQQAEPTPPVTTNAPASASTQTPQVDAEIAQAATLPAGTPATRPPVNDAAVPVLETFKATSKSLPSKPGNESVVDHLTAPVIPSEADSPLAPKSSVSLPSIPLMSSATSESPATALSTKNSTVTDLPGASPDARVLVSKLTELGLQNLTVRPGSPQSKSADRIEALKSSEERLGTTVAPIERESATTNLTPPPGSSSAEFSADQDRKRGERAATPAVRNVAEPSQKESAGSDQNSLGREVATSKATVTEQVESLSPVKYIVDDPKPIRVPGQITVNLQPPELGRLRIDLLEGTEGIIGRLRFVSDATRTVVERDIAQLHRSLADAGIRVERLDIVGVAPAEERSGVSSQNSDGHQASHRQAQGQGQGRQGASKDNPWSTGHDGDGRNSTPWMEQRTSPWVAMTVAAQGLNLVA